MHKMKAQSGASLIIVMICIAFFGSIVFLIFTLAPIYIEHFGVKSSLASMAEESKSSSETELRQLLGKRLDINDVRRVDAYNKRDVTIKKPRIIVDYEVSVPLFSNVNLLVSFHDEATLRN